MNKRNIPIPFIALFAVFLGFALGIIFYGTFSALGLITLPSTSNTEKIISTDLIDQELLDQVYDYINTKYVGDIPATQKFKESLVKGLVAALDDPYASYLDPDETKLYMESRNPDFEGIGVTLKYNGQNTEIETVLSGNPAETAGLLSGDIISKIDNEDFLDKEPSIVATSIRGEKGTTVVLNILRLENGAYKEMEFSIVRDTINVDNITFEELSNGIFKIDISQFIDKDPFEFNKSWDKVVTSILEKNSSPKGIVLDVRNNPGGYVYSVRYVVEEFLKNSEIIMREETKSAEGTTYRDFRAGKFESVPLVVLINSGSASASEILAAAIQDNQRGLIIGEKSVGKGVEQEVIDEIKSGGLLILPFQKWLTPSGNNISSGSPILPDVLVELDIEKYQKENIDTQLNAALEKLK